MSRLIIKNLPKNISADRLKAVFADKGEITDVQLKFSSEGTFRQFAFVGFKTEEQAQSAKDYFDHTYIDAHKIQIETCENIGSTSVKAWSKKLNTLNQDGASPEKKTKKKKKKKKKSTQETPEELKDDPKFAEFLSLHKGKTAWGDSSEFQKEGSKHSGNDEYSSEDDENIDNKKNQDVHEVPQKNNETAPAKKSNQPTKKVVQFDDSCTVKVKGFPRGCKKSQIKKFFTPLKIISLRCCFKTGMAYTKFKTEKDFKLALHKDRGFLDGNRISVKKYTMPKTEKPPETPKSQQVNSEADPLIETGRIFVRNLCYSVTETEIENHFKVYGPVTEVHLPLDKFTRKLKGFGFVTFMFPEHAVKAFSTLDGSSFQGRTLHLLPAKTAKSVEEEKEKENNSFKKQKETKLKASSGSWHNWNTLFLGANAVADVMAQKYNTTKSKLLDAESKSSLAVTMALGETQIVSETQEFLVNQGVCLEAFQNPQMERSKTVILVKNLPANTREYQIKEVFSVHGEITRIVLPPSGVTAIVEFHHPTEAKLAFRKLAYSKFQHLPLYLEWAPVNALGAAKPAANSSQDMEKVIKQDEEKVEKNVSEEPTENDEEVEEQGTVLFVKNLNFESNEESLRTHFESCGKVVSATIAKKPDPKNPGYHLSMGYGFVQFKKKKYANRALKELQKSSLDGHSLELKMSNRDTLIHQSQRKVTKPSEQKSTKIMVRNIPFEASKKEIKEIFSVFGELKAVRLPRKVTGEHRGFGFVDYLTRHDAKRAMESLGASTHVFGRRLVLEWAETEDTDNVEQLRKKTARQYDNQLGTARKRLKDSLPQDPDDLSS